MIFAGDLLENGAPPWLGDGYPARLGGNDRGDPGLMSPSSEPGASPSGAVVPGHGDVGDRAFVERSLDEMAAIARLARQVDAQAIGLAEAILAAPYPPDAAAEAIERALAQLRGSSTDGVQPGEGSGRLSRIQVATSRTTRGPSGSLNVSWASPSKTRRSMPGRPTKTSEEAVGTRWSLPPWITSVGTRIRPRSADGRPLRGEDDRPQPGGRGVDVQRVRNIVSAHGRIPRQDGAVEVVLDRHLRGQPAEDRGERLLPAR